MHDLHTLHKIQHQRNLSSLIIIKKKIAHCNGTRLY